MEAYATWSGLRAFCLSTVLTLLIVLAMEPSGTPRRLAEKTGGPRTPALAAVNQCLTGVTKTIWRGFGKNAEMHVYMGESYGGYGVLHTISCKGIAPGIRFVSAHGPTNLLEAGSGDLLGDRCLKVVHKSAELGTGLLVRVILVRGREVVGKGLQ